MTHTLITFIGRTKRRDNGYPKGTYHFPDGRSETRAFFGFPLREWLGADRMVILGTEGSMWDHLFEGDVGIEGSEEERLALVDAVENKQVSQSQLDELAPRLQEVLGGQIQLQLIPDAFKAEGQTEMVSMLAQSAEGASKLSLDITHSYRHLPMLTLTAALYLRFLRPELEIDGPWYGAFDPEAGEGPVIKLDGLLETADWLSALQRHEWLDDYNGIADQIERSHESLAKELRQANHFQTIHQEYRADSHLKNALTELSEQPLQNPGRLFQPTLKKRMEAASTGSRFKQQTESAQAALQRKDYMRAILIGYEAFVTRLTQREFYDAGAIFDKDKRQEATQLFRDKNGHGEELQQYWLLNGIRNVVAHANKPGEKDRNTRSAIKSQENLDKALHKAFRILLHPDSKQ